MREWRKYENPKYLANPGDFAPAIRFLRHRKRFRSFYRVMWYLKGKHTSFKIWLTRKTLVIVDNGGRSMTLKRNWMGLLK